MKKQPKKLVLKKETLRDLTVQRGAEVKVGQPPYALVPLLHDQLRPQIGVLLI